MTNYIKHSTSARHVIAAVLTIISNKKFSHTIHTPESTIKPTDHTFSSERHWPETVFCIVLHFHLHHGPTPELASPHATLRGTSSTFWAQLSSTTSFSNTSTAPKN